MCNSSKKSQQNVGCPREGNGEGDIRRHFAAYINPRSIPIASTACSSLHLKNIVGGCEGTEQGTKNDHGHGAAAVRGETGKAVYRVLVRMLVLTQERRCVGAGMKDQWWRKCWTASFGSCDGFWLLKTNVKAVLDCILEADQSISSSFANMVQSKFLMH